MTITALQSFNNSEISLVSSSDKSVITENIRRGRKIVLALSVVSSCAVAGHLFARFLPCLPFRRQLVRVGSSVLPLASIIGTETLQRERERRKAAVSGLITEATDKRYHAGCMPCLLSPFHIQRNLTRLQANCGVVFLPCRKGGKINSDTCTSISTGEGKEKLNSIFFHSFTKKTGQIASQQTQPNHNFICKPVYNLRTRNTLNQWCFLHGTIDQNASCMLHESRRQQVPEPELVGEHLDAARSVGGHGPQRALPQLGRQLQADPVHERVHVLGEVQEVPVQELRDREPRRGRHAHGGLQVVPLGALQLLLHTCRRVHPHLKFNSEPEKKMTSKIQQRTECRRCYCFGTVLARERSCSYGGRGPASTGEREGDQRLGPLQAEPASRRHRRVLALGSFFGMHLLTHGSYV